MRILITGASGFVAGHLASHLSKRGHAVTGLSRRGNPRWAFGDLVDEAVFHGIEVLIHCAHDFAPDSMQRTIDGTTALAEAARKAKVGRQIFVSTLSARPDATSEYGRSKYALERRFLDRGDTIVRPGTVIGKGGLFGKMAGMIESRSILPLVDGGKAEMTVIGVLDLCRAMAAILARPEAREYNLYYSQKPTMKEVMVLLRGKLGRKTLFMPAPAWMLIVPLTLLRWMHIRAPVDVENLKGYMKSREQVYASNLADVLPDPSPLATALAEAWDGE